MCVAPQKSDVSIPGVELCQTQVPQVIRVLLAIIPQLMAVTGRARQRHGCKKKKKGNSRSERSRKHTKLSLQ